MWMLALLLVPFSESSRLVCSTGVVRQVAGTCTAYQESEETNAVCDLPANIKADFVTFVTFSYWNSKFGAKEPSPEFHWSCHSLGRSLVIPVIFRTWMWTKFPALLQLCSPARRGLVKVKRFSFGASRILFHVRQDKHRK